MLASIGMLTFDLSGSDLKLDRTTSLSSATSSVTDGNKSSKKEVMSHICSPTALINN